MGVSREASQDEIKKAYRDLAHKYHPDKGGDEKTFKEINEAYQILGNTDKRAQYDKFGKVFEEGAGFGSEGGFDFSNFQQEGFGFDFGDLGDMMEDFFGFGRTAKKKDLKRGRDIEVEIELNLEEVLTNQEKEILLERFVVCSRCQGSGGEPGTPIKECFSCRGTGEVQQIKRTPLGSFTRVTICPECGGEGYRPDKPCNVCKGESRVKAKEKIKIFIPAGVDTNQVIKVEGKGEAGRKGGKAGDLYVRIYVKAHHLFKREGDDIFVSMPISFTQAALGDEVEIPSLEKTKILLKVPEGTETGKILRVTGKGIPHFSGYGRGNMYVELIVKTPRRLSKKQKELLEKLKEEGL